MRSIIAILLSGSLFVTAPANSIIIGDQAFVRLGGDLDNIWDTLPPVFGKLQQASYLPQYYVVGRLGTLCTASWIGDSKDFRKSYVLTAAHCLENSPSESWSSSKEVPGTTTLQFFDSQGRVVASNGTYYLHPYRIYGQPGLGGASTDIALIEFNTINTISSGNGKRIDQPLLYDGDDEFGNSVRLLGYGYWGIGSTGGMWVPTTGTHRAIAESTVTLFFENDHGMDAGFDPQGDVGGALWGSGAQGDSGSSWWQNHGGFPTIVATSSSTAPGKTNGTRVSRYIDWIKSIFPDAKIFSDATTIRNEHQDLISLDWSVYASEGTVAFTAKSGVVSDANTIINYMGGKEMYAPTMIGIALTDVNRKNGNYTAKFKAWRENGCGRDFRVAMNNAVMCAPYRDSRLVLSFSKIDNPDIPEGHWISTSPIVLEAQGFEDKSFRNELTFKVDLLL